MRTWAKRSGWLGVGLALLAAALVAACQGKDPGKVPATMKAGGGDAEPLWKIRTGRRQATIIKLELPVVVTGTRVEIGSPTGPAAWVPAARGGGAGGGAVRLYWARMLRGSAEGPLVDQLTGSPRVGTDAGSYLVPVNSEAVEKDHGGGEAGGGAQVFLVNEPMPLYVKVEVSAAQDPGVYRFPVTVAVPGRPALTSALEVTVSEVSLPAEPRVLAAMTTTTAELARLFPNSFGTINGIYLDRADPDHAAAVKDLDALVTAAQENGVALFVEDMMPRVKLDNVGGVILDWEAYDRVMQPYMDGTAFGDRIAFPVWLAPVPPKRLRDSPTQLRQYVAACADHFAAKGWIATPAFLHPALVDLMGGDVDEKLRAEISRVLKLHMTREMLAVTAPGAAVPQARLWVVDDADPRLPPAGELGTEASVRVWPWVCAAREGTAENPGVKGFVWRNAVVRAGEAAQGRGLLMVVGGDAVKAEGMRKEVPESAAILPALRLAWLTEGLNDTAMLGLLEKRSDPALVNEVLAGIVGRTGLTAPATGGGAGDLPTAPAGFLYAGWPEDKATWAAMPGMLEKLVLAHEPGERVIVPADDPLYLAAKVWLAKAHRPVARVAGLRFGVGPGMDGTVIGEGLDMLIENPVDSAVGMTARFAQLPGDFDLAPGAGGARGGRG